MAWVWSQCKKAAQSVSLRLCVARSTGRPSGRGRSRLKTCRAVSPAFLSSRAPWRQGAPRHPLKGTKTTTQTPTLKRTGRVGPSPGNPRQESKSMAGARYRREGRLANRSPRDPVGSPSPKSRERGELLKMLLIVEGVPGCSSRYLRVARRSISRHEPRWAERKRTVKSKSHTDGAYLPQLNCKGTGRRTTFADSAPCHVRVDQGRKTRGNRPSVPRGLTGKTPRMGEGLVKGSLRERLGTAKCSHRKNCSYAVKLKNLWASYRRYRG